jgi:hypothetical protein
MTATEFDTQGYTHPDTVDEQVLSDIVEWIKYAN